MSQSEVGERYIALLRNTAEAVTPDELVHRKIKTNQSVFCLIVYPAGNARLLLIERDHIDAFNSIIMGFEASLDTSQVFPPRITLFVGETTYICSMLDVNTLSYTKSSSPAIKQTAEALELTLEKFMNEYNMQCYTFIKDLNN